MMKQAQMDLHRSVVAMNNIGVALLKQDRFAESKQSFQDGIAWVRASCGCEDASDAELLRRTAQEKAWLADKSTASSKREEKSDWNVRSKAGRSFEMGVCHFTLDGSCDLQALTDLLQAARQGQVMAAIVMDYVELDRPGDGMSSADVFEFESLVMLHNLALSMCALARADPSSASARGSWESGLRMLKVCHGAASRIAQDWGSVPGNRYALRSYLHLGLLAWSHLEWMRSVCFGSAYEEVRTAATIATTVAMTSPEGVSRHEGPPTVRRTTHTELELMAVLLQLDGSLLLRDGSSGGASAA